MFKPTGGEWKQVSNDKTFIYALNKQRTNRMWFKIYGGRDDEGNLTSQEELESNVRLIAAAPRMFSLLQESVLQIDYLQEKCGKTGTGNATIIKIETLLKEIEGE